MGTLWQDFRHGFRLLGRRPGFAAAVAVTLGLGIGANTAIFSAVRTLLFRPYPFPELDQLVLAREGTATDAEGSGTRFAVADYLDLRRDGGVFADVAASRFRVFSLGVGDDGAAAEGALVSAGFFDLLHVSASIGRTFRPGEDQPGHDDVLLLGHDLWQRRFAGDARIVGKTVSLDGRPVTVIGIVPPNFHYPLGAEVWAPLVVGAAEAAARGERKLAVIGRLRNGSSLEATRGPLQAFAARLAEAYPSTNTGRAMSLLPLAKEQVEITAPLFLMLQAAAAFVLLLAGVNVASLFLARVVERRREIAIRRALGASAGQLTIHFLGETCVLALLSGAVAVAVAMWSVDLMRTAVPADIAKWVAGWSDIRLEGSVLWFGLLLTFGMGAVFGLVSGLFTGRVDVNQVLKEGAAAGASPSRHRIFRALVAAEVGLALVLLVGAGLMAQGFVRQSRAYATLAGSRILHLKVDLPPAGYADPSRQRAFAAAALEALSALPGIESAATAGNVPGSGEPNARTTFSIEGRPPLAEGDRPAADQQPASASFFVTLRIPIERGREFTDGDGPGAPPVAVISRSLARRFWPATDPVGQRLHLGAAEGDPWRRIVGIAADVKQNWWDLASRDAVYVPLAQAPDRRIHFVLRVSGDPAGLAAPARAAIHRMDASLPIGDVKSLDQFIAGPLSLLVVIGGLMTAFGVMALLLAAVGVAGLLAQGLAEREREFGVRLALGSTPGRLVRLAMSQALKLVALGLGLALPVVFWMGRWMSSALFGVVDSDLRLLAAVALFLCLVAALAAYVTARRAARLDPLQVLRQA